MFNESYKWVIVIYYIYMCVCVNFFIHKLRNMSQNIFSQKVMFMVILTI